MSRLRERYVRDAAVNWLTYHYQQKQDFQVILPEKEVGVSKESNLGRGRADGLIAALLLDGSVYTASIEAKSSKRLFNILPSYKDEKWLLHAIMVGVIALILAEIVGQWFGGWFLIWVLPVLVFILIGFAYLGLTSQHSYYRPIDVIAQVKGYPANEQWIAISTDAYNQLGAEQETLHKDCHREGIGLLRISNGERVTVLSSPKAKGRKDFLVCYARGERIRNKLQEMWKEKQAQAVSLP